MMPRELEEQCDQTMRRIAEIAAFAQRPLTETGAPDELRRLARICWEAGRAARDGTRQP
jgi:hypothetical protein